MRFAKSRWLTAVGSRIVNCSVRKPGSYHGPSVGILHLFLTEVLRAPEICVRLETKNKRSEKGTL